MEYYVGRVRNADQERTRLNEILRDIQRRFSLTETQTEDLRRQIGGITGVSGIVTSVNGNTGDVTITIQSIGGVPATREINTANSLTGGGNLSANRTLQLVGDVATPGPNQVYGTDGTGAKGWKADPSGGGGQVDSIVPRDGIDVDATDPANPEVSVLLSTDVGNALSFGTDDGLFAPTFLSDVAPSDLDATNSPSDGQVPSKATGTDKFTWITPSGGGGGGAPYITGIAPVGDTGVVYSWTPTLNNPGSTQLWEITEGALPAGLAIDATTGEVSGTPTDGGTYPYEMAATILTGTGAGATSYSRQRAVVDFPGLTPTRTSSCTLWLDFTDPRTMFLPDGVTPVSANDDEIYRMQDKANPSDRWRGGSEGSSFAYKTNVINGASSGNTVGAGRLMQRVGGRTMGEIITASAFTYIVVVRTQGVTTTNTNFEARQIIGDGTQYNGLLYSTASSGQHFIYNWDGDDDYARITGLGQNTFRLITAQHVGGQIRIRINGGSWTSSASGNTTDLAGDFYLGFGNTTPGGTIDFCQVACFSSALPDAELEDVEFYLANTVGISL